MSTNQKGVRYLQTAEGYILKLALDENSEVIGYKFVNTGEMIKKIKNGISAEEAFESSIGTYGRFDEAVKFIDPRSE